MLIYTLPGDGGRRVGVARPAADPDAVDRARLRRILGIALTVPSRVPTGVPTPTGSGLAYDRQRRLYAIYILATARFLRPGAGRGRTGVVAATWSLTGVARVRVRGDGGERACERPPDWGQTLNLIGLAVVSTVIAGMTMLLGLARLGPAPTALVATVEPVLTRDLGGRLAERDAAPDSGRRRRARPRRCRLGSTPRRGPVPNHHSPA